ncbi:MAG: UvrD-helicase domain-containing protein [Propionibacteriaceae bacterium]
MPTDFPLDAEQARVAEASVAERLLAIAGPGSGKTEVVSARVAHLMEVEELTGNEILVVSFSRSAVEAVRRRQSRLGDHRRVWVTTLDSLAARLLSDSGVDVAGLGFERRIDRTRDLLAAGELDEALPDVRHVIIDEFQDVVGTRARLLAELLRRFSQTAGFTVLGDPLQGIYDFQLDGDLADRSLLRDSVAALGAEVVELHGQYRADSLTAKRAMALRDTSGDSASWLLRLKVFTADMPVLTIDEVADRCANPRGSVAVLSRTNSHALLVAGELFASGLNVELLPKAFERSVDPWVAMVLGSCPASLTRDQFLERAEGQLPIDAGEAWGILRSMTPATSRYLQVLDVAKRIASGQAPTSLMRRPSTITVSTIHRAKGLEFDTVYLVDPSSDPPEEDAEASARALYVAITRPRRSLFGLRPGSETNRWFFDRATDRVIKPAWKGGTLGFEIRGSDCRLPIPPGAEGDTESAQTSLATAKAPHPVEIRLNPQASTFDQPVYEVHLNDVHIGTLGVGFLQSFTKRVHVSHKPGRRAWPRISGVYCTGLETAAGPSFNGPVGKNGLWLSPLIVGPATLDWRL